MTDDLPMHLFAAPSEMEAWLEGNHADSDGIWLKIAKKGSGVDSVSYAEAGAMRPAGLAEVEAARADGRWEAAYAGQVTAVVPADLRRDSTATRIHA